MKVAFIVFSVLMACTIGLANSTEDILIQILSRKFINTISDKYVSASIDPKDMIKIVNGSSAAFTKMMGKLGPSYIKIAGDSTNQIKLREGDISKFKTDMQISTKDWKHMYNLIKSMQSKPVVALPYEPKQWNIRQTIQILGASNKLGLRDCIWQLGSDFNSTDAINYVDDLSTLRTIVDAFIAQNPENDWGVVGSDISAGSNEDEVRLYSELSQHVVEAMGWSQSTDPTTIDSMEETFSVSNKDPALLTILNGAVPIWLSIEKYTSSAQKASKSCSVQCHSQGLIWAKTLGDAARNGFKVIYKPIDFTDLSNPSFSYYVSLLYKKVAGEEVFDTRVIAGYQGFSNFYSNCAKGISGGFIVMGVNSADSRLKTFVKMPNPYTGAEVHHYILTVNSVNGKIQLNGEDISMDAAMEPLVKMKKPTKAISLVLPPLSVGFWVFPGANLRECTKFETDQNAHRTGETFLRVSKSLPKTSKELLLHELIMETIQNEENSSNGVRSKRHTIIKKDSSGVFRQRRDVSQSSAVHDEQHQETHDRSPLNGELNKENGDLNIYKRSRRFIMNSNRPRRSGNLINALYKEVDDAKRKNIFAPYNIKGNNLFSRNIRSKRQIQPTLEKLLQKFDLKNVKRPNKPIGLNNQNAKTSSVGIPPIATIHDIYSPTVAETDVFKSRENTELPHGDVYFEMDYETKPNNPDFVAPIDRTVAQLQNVKPYLMEQTHEQIHDVTDDPNFISIPIEFFERLPNEHSHRPAHGKQNMNSHNTIPRFGELWEADVYQKANAPQPQGANHQAEISEAPQREMEFVIQGLQPTWLKNQENLITARNNLQQYYLNSQNKPIHITLPAQEYDNTDGFFTSKRRRRSVNPKMNDEIEAKLTQLDNAELNNNKYHDEVNGYIFRSVDKINLLEKMLQIVNFIHESDVSHPSGTYSKLSDEIKELESIIYRQIPQAKDHTEKVSRQWTPNDLRKKCKVMATSLEQKCLRDEQAFEKNLFKREAKIISEDKAKKSLRDIAQKLFPRRAAMEKKLREKRNIIYKAPAFEEDFLSSNYIHKTMSNENIPDTIMIQSDKGNDIEKIPELELSSFESEPRMQGLAQIHRAPDSDENHLPPVLHTVNGFVNKVMNTVNRHVSGWWRMLSE